MPTRSRHKPLPISSYALLLANFIPLIGVLFFDWNSVLVLALFWIENLVIGAFNLIRFAALAFVDRNFSAIGLGVFFLVHYGAFCSMHGMLLADLLGYAEIDTSQVLGFSSNGPQEVYLDGVAVFITFIRDLAPLIWIGLAGLILSHFSSFIENFILRGKIFREQANNLMVAPYAQIVVMHIGLLLGAVVLEKMGSPVWLLAVIVSLKIVFDFRQFQRRHSESLKSNASSNI